jgi:hypothetical protein
MLLLPAVLLLSLCTVPWPAACAAQKAKAAGKQQQQEPQHYFWNEITNEVQWEGEMDFVVFYVPVELLQHFMRRTSIQNSGTAAVHRLPQCSHQV